MGIQDNDCLHYSGVSFLHARHHYVINNCIGILGDQNVIKSLGNAIICREKKKVIKLKCTHRYNNAATIPGEAG